MKRLWTAALLIVSLLSCTREALSPEKEAVSPRTAEPVPQAGVNQMAENHVYVPGVAVVYFDEAIASRLEAGVAAKSVIPNLDVTSATRLFPDAGEYEPRTRREGLHRWYVVKYSEKLSYEKAGAALKEVKGVQYVEPSRVIRQKVTVNDPKWSQMWGQNNTAYPGYDVNCKPVWDNYTMGSPKVTVAVVDGGIQLNHPDMAANVASSGHYNYVKSNTTIVPHYHGTHVAGTIAAVNNNGVGVTGIAGGNAAAGKPGVKLLSLQVFQTNDDGTTSTAYDFNRALKEAADKGALISQNSWGYNFDFNDDGVLTGYELDYARQAHENPERSFTQAIDYFNKYAGCDNNGNQLSSSPMKGGVVIFAAGNENAPYGAPGNYDGCISVGAMNPNGSRASFSQYGDWVDLCAPGVDVPSTYLNGQYASLSGTSMACPHVSGVAALIVSYFGGPGFTAEELRMRLLGGAREIAASKGSKPIGPLVDAMGSFSMNAQGGKPNPVQTMTVTPVGHNLRVDFSATNAYAYLALASKQKSALQNVDYNEPGDNVISAVRIASNTDVEGTPLSILLGGLAPSTDYYVTVVAYSYDKKYADPCAIQKVQTAENKVPVIDVQGYPEGGFQFRHYEVVSIPVTCTDPDGDAITVSFKTAGRATLESNNGSESLYNFKLMCPLTTAGNYYATLDVTDEVGAKSRATIMYSVLANESPRKVKDPEVIVLEDKGQEKTFSLDEYFQDPDGEPLFYQASSMNSAIAAASVSEEGKLVVKALSQGVCRVKVSAEDHAGERVDLEITVLVRLSGTGEVFISGNTVTTGGSITIIPGVEEAPTTVRLISAAGVVVYETSGSFSVNSPLQLNLDKLAPGIYTLEVTYKGQVYTFTIVKR